jgi:tetratricopeptide (TPR) repeat protein
MEQNKFTQAESLLNSLKNASPGDFELWYSLSDIYQKRGELRKAREVLSEWLKANPAHQYASMVNQQIQFIDGQIRNQSMPALPKPDSGAQAVAPKGGAPAQGAGGIPGLAPGAAPKPAPKAETKTKDTALKATNAPARKS